MKLNDIIYYNKTTGFHELCTKSDLINNKTIIVYNDRDFITARIFQKLILDKEVVFDKILNEREFNFKSSNRHYLKLKLIVLTNTRIEFNAYAKDESNEEEYYLVKVVITNEKTKIGNIAGLGSIVVEQINKNYNILFTAFYFIQEYSIIGHLALGLGIHALHVLNAKWSKLTKEAEMREEESKLESKNFDLQIENKNLKDEIEKLKKEYRLAEKRSTEEIKELKRRINKLTKK